MQHPVTDLLGISVPIIAAPLGLVRDVSSVGDIVSSLMPEAAAASGRIARHLT